MSQTNGTGKDGRKLWIWRYTPTGDEPPANDDDNFDYKQFSLCFQYKYAK